MILTIHCLFVRASSSRRRRVQASESFQITVKSLQFIAIFSIFTSEWLVFRCAFGTSIRRHRPPDIELLQVTVLTAITITSNQPRLRLTRRRFADVARRAARHRDCAAAAAISAMYTARMSRTLSRPISSMHGWFSAIAELNTVPPRRSCLAAHRRRPRAPPPRAPRRGRVSRGAYWPAVGIESAAGSPLSCCSMNPARGALRIDTLGTASHCTVVEASRH